MSGQLYNHVVYWPIPQIGDQGAIVSERYYAVNLSEIDPSVAGDIESMLRSHTVVFATDQDDPTQHRTDPKIAGYRHLFKPFVEVKNRVGDGLCRYSMVWLPFVYAEYEDPADEPTNHRHPSADRLAGAG